MANDYRVRVTKMLIRKEFTELLKTKPVQSITVREICERTGINRSTFYNHYTDVYDLLEQIERDMLAELGENLKTIEPEDDLMPISLFKGIFGFLMENSDMCVIMLGENGDKRFVYKMLEMGMENCLDDLFPLFSLRFAGTNRGFLRLCQQRVHRTDVRWINAGMKKSPDELAATAKEIMTNALRYFDSLQPKK